jgi:hypothetical protein
MLQTEGGTWRYWLHGTNAWAGVNTRIPVIPNEWVHVAFTRAASSDQANFYLNGQLLTYTQDYTISGTTLTFSTDRPAPTASDVLRLFGAIGASSCIGIPVGGTSGQVLSKQSSTNYDAIWTNSSNIYTADGTLTGNRTVTLGAFTLSFNKDLLVNGLTVGTGVGKVIRQSKQRIIYQAGKSLEIMCTHVMAPAQTNLIQRVGYFDDKNGVFLQISGSVASFSIRNYITGSAVDDNVIQSNWNIDKLDGTGASGFTANFTKNQIFFADLQWLGVGRVRVGLVISGKLYYCHEFLHSNVTEGVYMSNPNLPIRWEIEATGTVTGTPRLEAICASVNSEGGYEINGVTNSVGSGTTAKAIASGTNGELVAIRMQSAYTEYATAFIKVLSAINTTSGPFRWRVVLNPTETGAGTWNAVTGSVMEANLTRTVTVDTGTVLESGYPDLL